MFLRAERGVRTHGLGGSGGLLVDEEFDVVVEMEEVQRLEGVGVGVHADAGADAEVTRLRRLNVRLVEGAGEVLVEGARLQIIGMAVGTVKDLLIGGDVDEDLGEVAGVGSALCVVLQHVRGLHQGVALPLQVEEGVVEGLQLCLAEPILLHGIIHPARLETRLHRGLDGVVGDADPEVLRELRHGGDDIEV